MRTEWSASAAARRSRSHCGSTPRRSKIGELMPQCLFCSIISREVNATIVYEDDRVVAFNDINPQAPTHVLVVPRRHIATLNDLTEEDDQIGGGVVGRAGLIAKSKGVSTSGFRTVFNTNREAGQTVFHIHLHVLGGRTMHWPPGETFQISDFRFEIY